MSYQDLDTVTPPKKVKKTRKQKKQEKLEAYIKEQEALSPEGARPAGFPGGMDALSSWLDDNLVYPIVARNKRVYGREYIQFVISPEGIPTKFEVLRSIGPDYDSAAIKTLKKMPKWIPAMEGGEAVEAYFVLPLQYEKPPKLPDPPNINNRQTPYYGR